MPLNLAQALVNNQPNHGEKLCLDQIPPEIAIQAGDAGEALAAAQNPGPVQRELVSAQNADLNYPTTLARDAWTFPVQSAARKWSANNQ